MQEVPQGAIASRLEADIEGEQGDGMIHVLRQWFVTAFLLWLIFLLSIKIGGDEATLPVFPGWEWKSLIVVETLAFICWGLLFVIDRFVGFVEDRSNYPSTADEFVEEIPLVDGEVIESDLEVYYQLPTGNALSRRDET